MDAWIMEESVVDPPGWGIGAYESVQQSEAYGIQPRLSFTQGNLNHRKFMHIIESGEICAGPSGWVLPSTCLTLGLHYTRRVPRSSLILEEPGLRWSGNG
jgi:hypothetical protein